MDVVRAGTTLVGVINKIYHQCEQRAENAQVLQELRSFLQGLQQHIQQTQEKALVLRSNSAVWALGALKEDLDLAILDASNILNKGFVRSLWDATKIQSRIKALRERVLTSFQTRLSMAALDVAIEGKQAQDAFQEAMLKVNKELQKSCNSTSISVKREQQLVLREELRQSLQPITIALESHSHRIEAAVSTIHSFQPHTSDAEKFFQDVLAALDGLSVSKNQGEDEIASSKPVTHAVHGHAKRGSGSVKWYEDPITWETMCDPVKATDGHTYDRWTILRKSGHMATSPFYPDDPHPFRIAFDDVDVRSRLFHKFPAQESQFKAKRAAYRDAALGEAQLGHFADSASMLRHVLEWAPRDIECSEKLRYVQCQMGAAAEGNSIPSSDNVYQPLARGVDQRREDAGIESNNTSSNSATPDEHQQQQLYPSRLDSARSNRHLLLLSTDGLSCRFRNNATCEESNTVGAAIADKPVPMHDEGRRSTTFFYFEIRIEELDKGSCVVGLGFAGSESFHDNMSPGCYPNSCGYDGDNGYIVANGRREQGGLPTARRGDTIGAGIHHGHKEIFFVYNGALAAVITNTLAGTVMPIVAIGSRSAYVKVAFNASAFLPEQGPSRLVLSEPDVQRSNIVSLSSDGLIAQYVVHAEPTPPHMIPVVSFLADYGACFRHPSQVYYFELTVIDKGFDGSIGIGFASRDFFQAHKMPGWYPNSCAYHGDDGNLFFGCEGMGQRFGPTFSSGDTVGAGIDHASSTVFFTKNGKKVGHTSRLRTSCALYPVIGGRSPGAVVCLNFGQAPFHYFAASNTLNLDIMEQPTRLTSLPSFISKHVSLSKDGLTACYIYPRSWYGAPAVTLIADRAICTFRCSRRVYYFELTVLKRGKRGDIAIGFCNQDHYNCFHLAGEHLHSCAYHGHNGRFLTGDTISPDYGPTFSTGDVVGVGVHFSSNTIFFAKNGHLVGHINSMDISHALIPTIGLHSADEKVHLNFGQAPFSLDTTSTHFPWR